MITMTMVQVILNEVIDMIAMGVLPRDHNQGRVRAPQCGLRNDDRACTGRGYASRFL